MADAPSDSCPACRRPLPAGATACPACGHLLAPPPRSGLGRLMLALFWLFQPAMFAWLIWTAYFGRIGFPFTRSGVAEWVLILWAAGAALLGLGVFLTRPKR